MLIYVALIFVNCSFIHFIHSFVGLFTHELFHLACVAGVRKGRGRELRARDLEQGRRFLSFLPRARSRAQIPTSPFPLNACHAGYLSPICSFIQLFAYSFTHSFLPFWFIDWLTDWLIPFFLPFFAADSRVRRSLRSSASSSRSSRAPYHASQRGIRRSASSSSLGSMAGIDHGDRADEEHSEQSENALSGNILKSASVNKVTFIHVVFKMSSLWVTRDLKQRERGCPGRQKWQLEVNIFSLSVLWLDKFVQRDLKQRHSDTLCETEAFNQGCRK